MSRDLYVFDLDYTLIDADSSTLWCRYMVENHIAEDPDFLNKEKCIFQTVLPSFCGFCRFLTGVHDC